VLSKFEDEADILNQAHDTMYGLAAAVFSKDISRALRVGHALRAGTVWVCHYHLHIFDELALKGHV
jgi:aldehyde dehydrogenase (NAD+)